MKFLGVLLLLLLPLSVQAATLSGFIADQSNGESLPYATVVLKGPDRPIGALSNVDGYYAVQERACGYGLCVDHLLYRGISVFRIR